MAHIQVLYQGLSPQSEVWSWGLRYSAVPSTTMSGTAGEVPPDLNSNALQAMANNVGALNGGNALPPDLRNRMPASARVTTVRVNHISTAGTLVSAAETPVTNGQGASTITFPLQTAAVVTLNLGAQFGRHGRGRTFLPYWVGGTIYGLGAEGMFSTEAIDAILTAYDANAQLVGATISDFGDWPLAPHLVVFSPSTSTVRPVENLSMDRRPDQQRRRADKATGLELRVRRNYPG